MSAPAADHATVGWPDWFIVGRPADLHDVGARIVTLDSGRGEKVLVIRAFDSGDTMTLDQEEARHLAAALLARADQLDLIAAQDVTR